MGSGYSGRFFRKFWPTQRTVRRRAGRAFHEAVSWSVWRGAGSRWRVRMEGPSRVTMRPRSRIRSRMASARSGSCRTRPHSLGLGDFRHPGLWQTGLDQHLDLIRFGRIEHCGIPLQRAAFRRPPVRRGTRWKLKSQGVRVCQNFRNFVPEFPKPAPGVRSATVAVAWCIACPPRQPLGCASLRFACLRAGVLQRFRQ